MTTQEVNPSRDGDRVVFETSDVEMLEAFKKEFQPTIGRLGLDYLHGPGDYFAFQIPQNCCLMHVHEMREKVADWARTWRWASTPDAVERRMREEHAQARALAPTSLPFVDVDTPHSKDYFCILDGQLKGIAIAAKGGPNGYVIRYVEDDSKGYQESDIPLPNGVVTGRLPIAGYKLVEERGHVVIIHQEDLEMLLYAKDPSFCVFPGEKQQWQLRAEAVAKAKEDQLLLKYGVFESDEFWEKSGYSSYETMMDHHSPDASGALEFWAISAQAKGCDPEKLTRVRDAFVRGWVAAGVALEPKVDPASVKVTKGDGRIATLEEEIAAEVSPSVGKQGHYEKPTEPVELLASMTPLTPVVESNVLDKSVLALMMQGSDPSTSVMPPQPVDGAVFEGTVSAPATHVCLKCGAGATVDGRGYWLCPNGTYHDGHHISGTVALT